MLKRQTELQRVIRRHSSIAGAVQHQQWCGARQSIGPQDGAASFSLQLPDTAGRQMFRHGLADVGRGFAGVQHRRCTERDGGTKSFRPSEHHQGHHASPAAADESNAIRIHILQCIQQREKVHGIINIASAPLFMISLAATKPPVVGGYTDVAPGGIKAGEHDGTFGRKRTSGATAASVEDDGGIGRCATRRQGHPALDAASVGGIGDAVQGNAVKLRAIRNVHGATNHVTRTGRHLDRRGVEQRSVDHCL